ncbi:YeeE/YedE family protein [Litorivicinus lipolyticus]|uniref:YeeE/YedE family protein n=1 Tax=Litorivicinus lipolyticus TaxID=418701 RepID=UPI003B58C273
MTYLAKSARVAGVTLIAGLLIASAYFTSLPQTALLALGMIAGIAFLTASFGFATAWRDLVTGRSTRLFRAQLLMIGAASLVMAPLIALSPDLNGFVRPVGVSLLVGAFIFGVGAQIANGCSSGSLFHLGQGRIQSIAVLLAFGLGTMLAIRDYDDWLEAPIFFAESLTRSFGPWLGTGLLLAGLVALFAIAGRNPLGWFKDPKSRPVLIAALVLAAVNLGILLVSGRPWSTAQGFALIGTQLDTAQGWEWDLDFSAFWSSDLMASRLENPWFMDSFLMPNLGVIAGAIGAGLLSGKFHPGAIKVLPLAGALLGGVLMGYGATIAFGCNIGALFSGIASGSVHGWIWLLPALAGSWVGVKLRPAFGYPNASENTTFFKAAATS